MSKHTFGAVTPYNPDMKLSDKYTLRDLTITNQPYPNMPLNQGELDNLKWLAKTLESMESEIGPFKLISAFRSPEVHNAVTGSTKVPPDRAKSFHEAGMAIDMYPTTMSIQQYYAKILEGPWKDKLGEIALKPTQNALHLSLPTEKYRGVAMVMDEKDNYVKQTAEQIQDWISEYGSKALQTLEDTFFETTYSGDIEEKKIRPSVLIIGGILSLGTLFLFFRKKKHA